MSPSASIRFDDAGRDKLQSLLDEACREALPQWLETRRWFADKGRGVARVEVEDALIELAASHWLALTVARVAFHDGHAARYLLPLALSETRSNSEIISASMAGTDAGAIADATGTAWFGNWLLMQLARSSKSPDGAWSFVSQPAAAHVLELAQNHPPSVVRAEQSNSSLRFDDILILKLFRRLQTGPNPDEEVLRALADAGFGHAPRYAGSIVWRSPAGETVVIAAAQEFVPNLGDGWTWMLRRLDNVAKRGVGPELDDFEAERLLGKRTGELHVTLGQVTEPGFTPEFTDKTATAEDTRRTLLAIEHTVGLLQERHDSLSKTFGPQLSEAIVGLKSTASRVAGYEAETGTVRIRVHGDYHLGQTLRTPDGDWTIIDFEGEPARPLDERRQRTSALKDVAGMLRSFAYARGVTERSSHLAGDPRAATRLKTWEAGARCAFLEGYQRAIKRASVPLVPGDEDSLERALAAWELDKALYEIAYEARNRPDWIELPLRGVLPESPDQSPEDV